MAKPITKQSRANQRLIWLTGGLCIACCALPLIGVWVGSTLLAGLAIYAEKAVLGILIVAGGFFAYRAWRAKHSPSCDLDGPCKPSHMDDSP